MRRVRLQMMQTEPFPARLTTSLADGDSLRYYPAYDLPGRGRLAPQSPVAAATKAQLLLVQRLDGGLTDRRHARVQRAVRLRRGRGRLRSPARPGRGAAGHGVAAGAQPLGGRLQRMVTTDSLYHRPGGGARA